MEREQTFANGQSISSQRGSIRTDYYKTGIVKATGLVNGDQQMDGKWVFYRENGTLLETGHYKGGVKHGIWVGYDKLGQLAYEAKFSMGKEVSRHQSR